MDEIQKAISEMEFKTIILLIIGYTLMVIGRFYDSIFKDRKMVYIIKVIPLLLALILMVTRFINKIHHSSFEGALITVLLVTSVISLIPKSKDWDS